MTRRESEVSHVSTTFFRLKTSWGASCRRGGGGGEEGGDRRLESGHVSPLSFSFTLEERAGERVPLVFVYISHIYKLLHKQLILSPVGRDAERERVMQCCYSSPGLDETPLSLFSSLSRDRPMNVLVCLSVDGERTYIDQEWWWGQWWEQREMVGAKGEEKPHRG